RLQTNSARFLKALVTVDKDTSFALESCCPCLLSRLCPSFCPLTTATQSLGLKP
ncbi:hypothetical protein ILYODFUR_020783, partial [Ilyodon furcidens]